MKKIHLTILVAWIAFFVGTAYNSVGKMPAPSNQPFQWYLPFVMFALMAVPAWHAYKYGKQDE